MEKFLECCLGSFIWVRYKSEGGGYKEVVLVVGVLLKEYEKYIVSIYFIIFISFGCEW